MKHSLFIITFILLLSLLKTHGQEVRPISKEAVVQQVLENNQHIKISEQSYYEAKGDYRQTNAVFLPNISISATGFSTTNPLMAFGSRLNQEAVRLSDLSPEALNNPVQTQNFATIFEIEQPLINMDAIFQRKAAKNKMMAAELKSQRTIEYIEFELEKAFMQLQLAYKAVAVLETSLASAEENLKVANNSFEEGYIQRADVLLVEVRVSDVRSQLQTARSNVKNASEYLSFLMNDSTGVMLMPTDTLRLDKPAEKITDNLSEERADLKAMSLATDAYESLYKADKLSFAPSLNAFGSYQMYDEDIFKFGANGYIFGAALKWNILEGTRRFGKTDKSRAAYEKSKLEYEQYTDQSRLELNKTLRLLSDTEVQLELSQLAMNQSDEALRIRTNRYKEGLEKTTDLLIAETQYAQRQLEYYQTVFNYNRIKAYLKYLTTTR